MPVQIPVTQTGLEASIEAAAKKAGKSLRINMGPGAKSIEGLSQPLGRITGKADEFTKSMEAANARVLAFGASVGVLSSVQRGFADLVRTTIEVEKSLASINSILGTTNKELNNFKATIFDVARNTEQSFDTVANAALELSRQGLKAEEVTKRLNDSLVLSRLSGLGAAEAVAGLTSAINSFNSTGITSAEVLNKLSAAAVSAAVSERDLIEGIKRSGSVAIQAGVSFDELVGVITAVQERTARGGAVIGNSFKTIFTRIQSLDKLETMQNLGVEVTDASGQVLSATKLIQNLGKTLETLPDAKRLQIAENLVGKFQIAPFLAILEDYNRETSTAIKVTEIAGQATNEAYNRNIALNQTLSAVLNKTTINLKELANTLGEIGVTDSLKNVLDFFSGLFGKVNELLDGEGVGSDFAKGIVKGIGGVISGPGLAIFGAIILKLTADLAKFGVGSLKTFFGLNRAAKEQATLQGQITSTLLGNETIQKQILAIEKSSLSTEQKKAAQTKFFTTALNEQLAVMQRMQSIAARVAPGVMAGTRGVRGRGAGGYIPNFNAVLGYGSEQSDINRGVGGAPKSARPVTIPNFNFGGGQKGTMVANTSEYMVPNFAGTGGSAIFNQDMIASMGLPAGAKKIGAAGGYIPNFAKKPINTNVAGMIIPRKGVGSRRATGTFGGNTFSFPVFGIDAAGEKVREEKDIKKSVEKFSIGLATRESKSMTGGRPTAGKINRLANQGAIGGLAGAIFETALSSLLKSKDFDFGETATFDYVGQSAINNIGDISPALKASGVKFLDAKIADNSGTRNSMAKKITTYFGASPTGSSIKGKGITELMKASGRGQKEVLGALGMKRGRGASGYIPNFASPLEAAIGREKAAGLPINQIRINQDPSLRNAGNPMGLAVTNTRDEPTGAIPNFAERHPAGTVIDGKKVGGQFKKLGDAVGKSTDQLNQNTKGQRDMLGGIFAAQIAMSALTGATSGATEGFGLFMNRLSKGLSGVTTAAFAGSALKSFGDSMTNAQGKVTGFGKALGKAGVIGAVLGASVSMLEAFNKMGEDSSGITQANNLALAKMADAARNAAISLGTLSKVDQLKVGEALTESFGGGDGTMAQIGKAFAGMVGFKFGEGDLLTQVEIANAAANTVSVTQSQQETIKKLAAEAVAAMVQQEGVSIDDAVKRIEKEVRSAARISFDKGAPDRDFTAAEGSPMTEEGAMILSAKEFAVLQDNLIAIFEKQNKEKEKSLQIATKEKQEEAAKNKILEKQKRITASIAKEQIKDALERVKAERGVLDAMDSRILRAETMGGISEKELNILRQQREEIDANLQKRNATVDAVEKIVDASKELTFVEEVSADLKDKLNNLSQSGVATDKEREVLLENAKELIKEGGKEVEASLVPILNALEREKDRVDAAKELLDINRNITFEIGQQKAAMDAALIRSGIGDENASVKRELQLRNQIARARLGIARGENDPLNINETRGRAVSNAISQRGIASLENDLATLERERSQREQFRSLIQDPRIQGTMDETSFKELVDEIKGLKGENIIKKFEQLGKDVAGLGELSGDEGLNKLAAEIEKTTSQFINNNNIADQTAKANLKLADAAVDAAGKLGDLNFNQLIGDMITNLESPQNIAQARIDALTSTDPTARAKFNISEGNRAAKIAALSKKNDQGLIEFADIVREEEFSGQLIDASAQFAQNIGRAMTDAIAKGESLGGLLRSAAADFFNTLSQAYMQRAVNSIMGLGQGASGGGGFLGGILGFLGRNSGGPVTGGSGTRDDVPALLTGGEFVMRKGAVKKYGAGFMAALNQGQIPMMNKGGLFTPGTYGQGAMKGKKNLLDFATQAFTTGAFDAVSGGAGFASVALEPQSAALTMFGRRNSPQFAQEQASKRSAFGLYVQQINKEKQMREQEKQASRGLLGSILSFGVAFGLDSLFSGGGKGTKKSATGGSIPYAAGVDTVPAMLSGGEFVMNAAATQRIGRGTLSSMNSGGGSGGSGAVINKLDELISVSDNQGETIINITVNSDGTSTEGGNGDEQSNNLAGRIRDVVKQVIDDEKRLGGSLRQARA